jgi:tRNA threonylcarbamoyladenosine biosynthesis protein TsaE
MKIFKKKSIGDYKEVIEYVISTDIKVVLLEGNLGSGKTTFVKSFCKYLNIKDKILSPTFNIINEYNIDEYNKIYHFDLYRLKSREELIEIDFLDYIDSGSYCFIEWPEICRDIIKGYTLNLKIKTFDNLNRDIIIN